MSRYAIIDQSGNVVSAAVWDGVTPWEPGDGLSVIRDSNGEAVIGGRYADGEFIPPEQPPLPQPSVDDYKLSIVALLDAKAQERRYDGALSISTYLGSTNPQWAAEAEVFVAWRDEVWAYSYAELDKVLAHERKQPTTEDFLAELPTMSWPA